MIWSEKKTAKPNEFHEWSSEVRQHWLPFRSRIIAQFVDRFTRLRASHFAVNDPSFHVEFISTMCELVIIVPFVSLLLMIMIISFGRSRGFGLFERPHPRDVCESECVRSTLVFGREHILMKSTGIVTIGGQSREFFLSPRLFIHSFSFFSSFCSKPAQH